MYVCVHVCMYIYVVAALYAFILHICKCIELHRSLPKNLIIFHLSSFIFYRNTTGMLSYISFLICHFPILMLQ